MSYEHKPGSFTLFKNDKGDNEKRPDYRGEGKDLAGNAIEVAGWVREGGGKKFLSCTMKAKDAPKQYAKSDSAGKRDGGVTTMDSDIPW